MDNFSRKGVMKAMVVATAVMIAGGVAHRIVANYYGRPTDSVPLANEDLARLPMDLGPWIGTDVPLDEAIIRATDTDAHINRTYRKDGKSVAVFIAYGVNARQLLPHTPRVCYPQNGWTQDDDSVVDLELTDKSQLPCTIYRFTRGGLTHESVRVLNYYIVDGQYSPNEALLRNRAWRGSSGIRYMLQVQVSCGGATSLGESDKDPREEAVRDFVRHCAPELRELIDSLTTTAPSATTKPAAKPNTTTKPAAEPKENADDGRRANNA